MPTKLRNYSSLLTPSSGSLSPFKNFDIFKILKTLKASHFNFSVNFIILTRGQTGFYNKMCPLTSYVCCLYGRNCLVRFSNSCCNFSSNFYLVFFLQAGLTYKTYTYYIVSYGAEYYNKKHISSTFDSLNIQTSLDICFNIPTAKKSFYLCNKEKHDSNIFMWHLC